MYENLRCKVDELFQNAPRTNRANEIKEEILANVIDRYNDLIQAGKNENDAVNIAISGIGDVDEIIRGLRENNENNYGTMMKERKKFAARMSIAIGLYILSVAVEVFCTEYLNMNDGLSSAIMLSIDAVATVILIYNFTSRPKYIKTDDSIVEDFKAWRAVNDDKRQIKKSIRAIIWSIVTLIYFIVSFIYGDWSFSWIIFLIGAAIERIISLIFELRK